MRGYSRGLLLTCGLAVALLLTLGGQALAFQGTLTLAPLGLAVLLPAVLLAMATLVFRDLLARDGSTAARVLAEDGDIEAILAALQVEARWRADRRQLPLLVGLSVIVGGALGYLQARARPHANLNGVHLETVVGSLVLLPAWCLIVFTTSTRLFALVACILGAHSALIVGLALGGIQEDAWLTGNSRQPYYSWPARLIDDTIALHAVMALVTIGACAAGLWWRWRRIERRRLPRARRLLVSDPTDHEGVRAKLRRFRLRDRTLILCAVNVVVLAAVLTWAVHGR